jgi:hypothetical protein
MGSGLKPDAISFPMHSCVCKSAKLVNETTSCLFPRQRLILLRILRIQERLSHTTNILLTLGLDKLPKILYTLFKLKYIINVIYPSGG